MSALAWAGRLLGIVGIVVCAVAGLARVTGHYVLGGFPHGTSREPRNDAEKRGILASGEQ